MAKVGKARNRELGKFKKVIKDKEKESMRQKQEIGILKLQNEDLRIKNEELSRKLQ